MRPYSLPNNSMLNETSKHTPSTSNKYTLAMKVIELGKVSDIFYFDFFDSFDSKFNSKEWQMAILNLSL
jgi:hypothetical protein